jgi:predicted PurR-regulated permease PerM
LEQQSLTGRDIRMGILYAALVFLIIKFIFHVANILLILGVSALLATVLSPIVDFLCKYKVPRQAATGLLVLALLGSLICGWYYVTPPAIQQISELAKRGPQYYQVARQWMQRVGLERYLPENLGHTNLGTLLKPVLTGASRATMSAVGAVGSAFLVFVITVYLLANPRPVIQGIIAFIHPPDRNKVTNAGKRIVAQVKAWAAGILIGMFFIFLVTWIALSIIGLEQAFLFAVIAGLFEAVPVIGPIVSAIPPAVVALFSGEPITALWVLLAFAIIQQFEGNVLIPLVMSKQLSLHPVAIILAVLIMGGVFGIVGIFVAAPTAAVAGVLIDEFYLKGRNSTND